MAQVPNLIYGTYDDATFWCDGEGDDLEYTIGYGDTPQEARSMFITVNNLDWVEFAKQDVDKMVELTEYAQKKFSELTVSSDVATGAFLMWYKATFCE